MLFHSRLLFPTCAALAALCLASNGYAQGSAFTYQGRLTDGGTPANGAYDLRFILYNADAGGSQVGNTLLADDVPVSAGGFTVVLDFGPNVFDGQARWLEVAVRPGASTGIYTVLSPRQPVTPAPYAMFAAKAGSVANGVITSAQLAPGAVTAGAIASGAITADKIPDGAITTNKLAASVLAGLGGSVVVSPNDSDTNLLASGYVRSGSETVPNDAKVVSFSGAYQRWSGGGSVHPIWTGTDLLIWQGIDPSSHQRYSSPSNQFTTISTVDAPPARVNHAVVWAGTELFVWGGLTNNSDSARTSTGGRYNPATDSWIQTSVNGAPEARRDCSAVWTGSYVLVWGGFRDNYVMFNNGGRYSPASNSWNSISTVGAPVGRYDHVAVWTGTRMLVWGGSAGGSFQDAQTGGLYDPLTDTWTAMSTANAPNPYYTYSAVWTGSALVIWDIDTKAFKKYLPTNNTWQSLSPTSVPFWYPRGVWTGDAVLYFDGETSYPMYVGKFDWVSQSWSTRPYGKLRGFSTSSMFWDNGSVLLVDPASSNPLLRYTPQNPLYLYLKP